MIKPIIYFRGSLAEEKEKEQASHYFSIVERRTAVPSGSLVIPRYSALPYNKELEEDIEALESKLINSHREHVYVANLRNYYYHIVDFTPHTWFALDQIPDDGGPFVLKGATNSMKHQWTTCMYAQDKQEASHVHMRLSQDGHVGTQPIYIREYIPLKKLCDSIGPQAAPISEEYRFFIYKGHVLTGGFYWSNYLDDFDEETRRAISPTNVPARFLQSVIDKISPFITFFVIDIARTEKGNWIVVELNDGQQSGLSACDPNELYKKLRYWIEHP